MRKLFSTILATVLVFGAVACGGKSVEQTPTSAPDSSAEPTAVSNPNAGTYNCEKYKCVGDDENAWAEYEGGFVLELKADGTGTSKRNGDEYKIEWKLEGDEFSMDESMEGVSLKLDYSGTLKDGELHIYGGDPENDFTSEYMFKKAN